MGGIIFALLLPREDLERKDGKKKQVYTPTPKKGIDLFTYLLHLSEFFALVSAASGFKS